MLGSLPHALERRPASPLVAPQGAVRPKLLYLVTDDWYFWSHRLPMARAAQAAGFAVAVTTRVERHGEAIRDAGFALHPLAWRREERGIGAALRAISAIVRLYRAERPDIVHHVALRSVVFGAIAARLAGLPRVVNAITGFGYAFASPAPRARLARLVLVPLLRLLLGHRSSWVVVQNEDDRALLLKLRLTRPERISVIPGSGIDLGHFRPKPEPGGRLVAALVSRMLRDKGVVEAVEAARLLRQRGVPLAIALVGAPDPGNPASLDVAQLRRWQAEGVVEWWGYRTDVSAVWDEAAIAVLPSYREGLPKSLVEAAACARPLVATNVPGCRAVVRHGVNGLLVEPGNAAALADALATLAADPQLRARLGSEARRGIEAGYSDGAIGAQTVALYRALLAASENAK